jgi:hypothetical protein
VVTPGHLHHPYRFANRVFLVHIRAAGKFGN